MMKVINWTRLFVVNGLVLIGAIQINAQPPARSVIGILIDNTGSMRLHLGRAKDVANEIISSAKADTFFSLYAFKTTDDGATIAAGMQCSANLSELKKDVNVIGTLGGADDAV